MNQLFKKILSFLLLFIFIPFSSCEKDSEQDSSKTKTKYNFTVREVSLSSLSHDTELLNIAGKIKPKKSNLSGKLIYDPLNDFYFDDTSGKEIVAENGQKSYTFQIITDDDNSKVENLLFTQKENGEYDAYRVQYNFTEEELKTMTIEDIAVQKANYTLITSSKPNFTGKPTATCWSIEVWVDITPDQGENVGFYQSNPYSGGYISIAKVCSQTSTEIETGTDLDGGNSGWGTGTFSGNQSPVSGSGIYTTPVVTPGTKFIKSIYPKILRSDFFNLSEKAHELSFNYLNLHNFDVISQSKVRGALTKLNVFNLSELPYEIHTGIFDNLVKNDFSFESIYFGNYIISLGYEAVNLDIPASFKSPMNIDRTAITNATPEGEKFNAIYDILKESPEFKELFIKIFNNNERFNVKFEIGNIGGGANGDTKTDLLNPTNNKIIIDANFIKNNSKLVVAKTILHECIHAFLNVKLCDGELGNIPNINNNDFYNIVNQSYDGFNNNQAQHNFIYNYMLPTMEKVLAEIKDKLVSTAESTFLQDLVFHPESPSVDVKFTWTDFYHNLALSGLQDCTFFKNEIATLIKDSQTGEIKSINVKDQVKLNYYNQYQTRINGLSKN
ncbi:hypothetical protein [Flavobacterium quisquiliarum]|uniref:SprT-like family protein n=1 Tax=Flavobacterium quisquiliarum TaxID=1834436 RepID=A0ABV8WEB8_9FLAO|nr:hypothetical protein [Flavobacterium quisquiliarum]MBW1657773.1 hypothetical protein [Flavobacterium quisquiliarum]NWL04112.1 hypothetical protein [Flavobacterium collinsii]